MNPQETFQLLRPACNSVMTNPTRETLQELQKKLDAIPADVLQELQEYVLFPLRLGLKREDRVLVFHHIIDTVKAVFFKTKINNWATFKDILLNLFLLISQPGEITKLSSSSEELKLSVVQCAQVLIKSLSDSFTDTLYSPQFTNLLAHVVLICLHLAEVEKYIALRIGAMEVITAAAQPGSKCADCFSQFIPRVASKLRLIASNDIKENHKVIVSALRTWGYIVSLVMDDGLVAENSSEEPKAVRSSEWYTNTSEKLVLLLQQMAPLASHHHWKVRLELVTLSESILTKCAKTMSASVSTMVKLIVILSEDDDNEVALKSRGVLDDFSRKCQEVEGSKQLVEILEEDFFSLTSRLPGIFNKQDEANQESSVKLLIGYLQLLGPKLNHMLSSSAHLDRLFGALLQVVQLDVTQISLLHDFAAEQHDTDSFSRQWKHFKLFESAKVKSKLQRVCYLLGRHVDPILTSDYLLDRMNESEAYRKEAIVVLNQIVSGFESSTAVTETVLSEYLEPKFWCVQPNLETVVEERNHIVQACLLLEGVADIASLLGRNFQKHLLIVLYSVMERAGNPSHLIGTCGLRTLTIIAKACGYDSASSLLTRNVHCFSHSLSVRLGRVTLYPEAPTVMRVAVEMSKVNIMPLVQDRVERILMQSMDKYHEEKSEVFLHVFYCVVVALSKGNSIKHNSDNKSSQEVRHLVEVMRDYHESHQLLQKPALEIDDDHTTDENSMTKDESDNDATYPDEMETDTTDVKKQLPPQMKMTEAILERSLHFLPSHNTAIKLLVLDILRHGVLLLADHEDALLPLVHKIWSPLVNRFSDTDLVVLQRSFKFLCVLGATCGDFVRRRTLDEALPRISHFLLNQTKLSAGKSNVPSYRFTQAFKLQLCMLSGLGDLSRDLDLRERNLDMVLTSCVPYLCSSQPQELQMAAVEVFRVVQKCDFAAVWLKLRDLWTPRKTLIPPSNRLIAVQMTGSTSTTNEYYENVNLLLKTDV